MEGARPSFVSTGAADIVGEDSPLLVIDGLTERIESVRLSEFDAVLRGALVDVGAVVALVADESRPPVSRGANLRSCISGASRHDTKTIKCNDAARAHTRLLLNRIMGDVKRTSYRPRRDQQSQNI
jgi:hypothetical protein